MVKNLRLLKVLFSLGTTSALVSLVSLEPVFAQTVTINCQSGCTNNVANAVAVITGAGGTINSLTIDDNPGTGTPISDLSGLSVLTGLTDNLNVRRIGQNGATITNLSGLSNLASVGGTITIGGSATNANPGLTDIGLSGLTLVGANFTVSHNPNVTSIAYPGVSVVGVMQILNNASVNSISGFAGTVGNVSVTSNGALSSVNLGFSAVTSNLTVQNNGTGVSSLTFPNLMTVGGSISMNNTAANAVTATVDFPSLTGVTGNFFLIRVLGSLNAPLLTNVNGELRINTNSTFANFDASLPSLTGVGNLTIQNNPQLSTCCRVLCQVAVSGSRIISGNAPGCQSMANINATCTPTACPSNQTRSTDMGECNYTATGGEFNVTCPVSSISYALSVATTGTYSNLNGVDFNIGTTTVTVTVTAPGGSTATCAFTVAVNETEAPAITCPSDQPLSLDGSCSATLPDYTGDATASDNCGTPVVSQLPAIGTTYTAPTTVTVTLTATDASGNTSTCTFALEVVDDTAPTITCPPDQTLSLDVSCSATLPDYTDDATASDNCGDVVVTQFPDEGEEYNAPTAVTVTLTATDEGGNTSTCTFAVEVVDDTAPEIACPVTAPEVLYLDASCSAMLPDYSDLASDNCGLVEVTQDPEAGETYNGPQTITVTLTATDDSGNTATCTFAVDIVDDTPPSITCPDDQTLSLDGGCSVTLPDYTDDATASDNCETPTVTQDPAIGASYTAPQEVTVTLTATDDSGNTATCAFIVSVVDDTPPTITCPPDQTLSLDGLCSATLPDYTDDATASDNCGDVVVTQFPDEGEEYNAPTAVTVTLTATDEGGNTSTCTFAVEVVDDTAPEITCPVTAPEVLYLDAGCSVELPDYSYLVTDNCGLADVMQDPEAGETYNGPQTITVTLTATDDSGNTATCTFAVDIVDDTPPSITCPDDQTLSLDGGCSVTLPDYTDDATASDNCETPTVTQDPAIGASYTAPQEVTVTLTATDDSGNTATCAFIVSVVDDTPPTITCPPDQTLSLDGLCSATLPDYTDDATASDNCGDVVVTQFPDEGEEYNAPTAVTVTLTATDEGGNTSTCTFAVEVVDDTAPEITCPVTAPEVLYLDAGCSVELPDYSYLVTDNCGLADVMQDPEAGETYNGPQTITVTLTATDNSGNTTTCTFEVELEDNLPPVVTCPDDITQGNDTGECGAVVEFMFSSTDNCSVDEEVAVPASGSLFPVGETTVVVTATDAAGNTGTCSFTVTIVDEEDPVAVCPDNIIQGNDLAECDAVAVFTLPNSTDNCPGVMTEADPPSGTVFVSVGMSLTVTVTATDAAGNTATCTFTVTVEDDEAPLAGCPGDISQGNDPGACGAIVEFELLPTTDNCPGATSEADPPSGSFFPVGVTVVVVTATDAAGNTNTCTFEVVVEDEEAPEIACPTEPVTLVLDEDCSAELPDYSDLVSDNCGLAEVTQVPEVGTTFDGPTTVTVTLTATDDSGNTSTCTFEVGVVDETAPEIACPTEPVTLVLDEDCSAELPDYSGLVSDNCGLAEVTQVPEVGTTFDGPTTVTVTLTATDASGNTSTCTFEVGVVDETAPEIACPTEPVTLALDEDCSAELPDYSDLVSDNCGLAEVTQVPEVGTTFDGPTTVTVTLTATDDSGNTSTCTFEVDVVDETAPEIACPTEPVTLVLDEDCSAELPDYSDLVSDNCGLVEVTQVPEVGTTFDGPTTVTVTLTATDASGNTSTCTFEVGVVDETAPEIACPTEPVTLVLDEDCSAELPDYSDLVSDNCGLAEVTQVPEVGTTFDGPTTVTVTLTATDASGNTSTCTFEVGVVDETAPEIACPTEPVTLVLDEDCSAELPDYSGLVSDNCGLAEVTQVPEVGTTFDGPTTVTVTLTATDASGNTSTCTFEVDVVDETAPEIACPTEPVTLVLDEDCSAELPDYSDLVSDNCGLAEVTQVPEVGTTFDGPTTVTVTLTATDDSGNTSTCTFEVDVVDETAPEIACPTEPVTLVLDEDCSAELPDYSDLVSDNCGLVEVTQVPEVGTTFDGPTTVTVTLTATDDSGNTSTCTFEVDVVDETAPEIACPTEPVTLVLDEDCSAELPDYSDLVSDNCGLAEVTQVPEVGTTFDGPTTVTVTLTATDASGNTSTCTFEVGVVDETAPEIACPTEPVTLVLDEDCSAELPDYSDLVSDNCGLVEVTQVPEVGTTFDGPTTVTVTLTATDASGNTSTCTFEVGVVDETAPEIACPTEPVTLVLDEDCSAELPDYSDLVSDNCGLVEVTQVPEVGTTFDGPRTVTVTLTATDDSGNTSTCTFEVGVVDETAPEIACPTEPVTLVLDEDCSAELPDYSGLVSDNCGLVEVTQVPEVGTTFDGPTTVTVTLTATDDSGNTSTCTFEVDVVDETAPEIACPTEPVTLVLDEDCSAELPDYSDLVSDNCGLAEVTQVPEVGTTFDGPTTVTVTLTATDASGNTSTCTFEVDVVDETAPEIACPTEPVTLVLDEDCSAELPDYSDLVSDNCGLAEVTQVPEVGTTFDGPTTVTVTLTATDDSGNTSTCTFEVGVVDETAPEIACPTEPVTLVLDEDCSAELPDYSGLVSDNCGLAEVTQVPEVGTTFDGPTTVTVTLTATDDSGNTSTCTFEVGVVDETAPEIACPTEPVTLVLDEDCSAELPDYSGLVSDNCGLVEVTQVPEVGTTFDGPTTVTLTATDDSGNTSTCTFEVGVVDETAPEIACPTEPVTLVLDEDCSAELPDYSDLVSDNCGLAEVTQVPEVGTTFDGPTTVTVTLTATDASGNTSTCTFEVGVVDETAPEIACPTEPVTLVLDEDCSAELPDYSDLVSDNCGLAEVTQVPEVGTTFDGPTTVTVTLTATDDSGNTSTCTFEVGVVDETAPEIACPTEPVTLVLDEDCSAELPDYSGLVSDNCGLVEVTQVPEVGTTFDGPRTVTVTLTATDASGNTSTCTFEVGVVDETAPEIACPTEPVTLVLDEDCSAELPDYSGLVSDNCGLAEVTQVPEVGTTFDGPRTVTVTLTATDDSGNTSTCTFEVGVVDETAPEIACPTEPVTLVLDEDCSAELPDYSGLVSDNCGLAEVTQVPEVGTTFDGPTTVTVTLTATDASGNTSTCTFEVGVVDETAPEIACPTEPVTLVLDEDCSAELPDYSGLVSDNCGLAEVTQVPEVGTTFDGPTTVTVTLTATDDSGNTSTCTFEVGVVDETAPEIACPTEPVTLVLDEDCSAELPDYSGLVSDNCGLVEVTQVPEVGTTFDGPTTVTVMLTATDASGNTSTCTFEVGVVDETAPEIACPTEPVTLALDEDCSAELPDYSGLVSDDCGLAEVTQVPEVGTTFDGPTTVTVTLTATDDSGNTSTCTFEVGVVDETAPEIACPTEPVTLVLDEDCSAELPDYSGLVSDNCGLVEVTQVPEVGTTFDGPTTVTVTLTATDASGNTSTCTFEVGVVDETAPEIACPTEPVTLVLDEDCSAELPDYSGLVSDNCGLAEVTQVPEVGTTFDGPRTVTVTLTATDDSGNTSTCTFEVGVVDETAPEIACPTEPVTLVLDEDCSAELPDYSGLVSDNCGLVEVTQVPEVGTTFDGPTTVTVTLTATDDSGNTSTCTFEVGVVDETAPEIACPTEPVTLVLDEDCSAELPDYSDLVSDDCGLVEVTQVPEVGTTFDGPTTVTVTLTATDDSGNTSTCTFEVGVVDETAPEIACPTEPVTLVLDEDCSAELPDYSGLVSDNCGLAEVTQVPEVGTTFDGPTTVTVTLTATDDSGNTSTCTFEVEVVDEEAPVVLCPEPSNPYSADAGKCYAELSFAAEAEDNCGEVEVVYSVEGDAILFPYEFPVGVTTVLVTVTDESGNEVTCEFEVVVEDAEEPVIECPETQTLPLGLSCSVSLPNYAGLATVSDNCSVLNVNQDPGVGTDYTAPQEVTVVLTAIDAAGNTATCAFVVEVVDNTLPTVNCPFPLNPYSAEAGECYKNLEFSAEAFDNCNISESVYTVEDDEITFPFDFSVGTTVVLFTATDINGNTATCTFEVIVRDEEDPVVTCPEPSAPYSADAGECFAALTFEADAEDNCGIAEIAYFVGGDAIEFPYEFPVGTTTVEVVVTDEGGNTATCAFVVEVADTEDPVVSCPEPLNPYEAEAGDCFAELTFEADAEDNCGIAEIAYFVGGDAIEFPYEFPVGTTTVEVVVTDESGNAATCVFEVEVVDEVPPMISCPPTQTLVLGPTCSAALPDYTGLAEASDNCSETVTVTQAPLPGTTVSGVGAMTVTLTVDDGSGNTATCTFVVNKADNTAPSITCPATQTLSLGPTCSATLPDYTGSATTSDGCSATVTVTQTPAAGTTVSGAGAMTVTLTANDGNGNTATCSFTVNKVDDTPPVFTFVPGNVTVQCNSIPTNPGTPTATDACGAVTITYNGPTVIPGSCSDARTIIHTWTATDAGGNTSTATRTVTVVDTQKPNFTSTPANITVQCDNIPPVGAPTATDNCDNDVAITYNGQTRTNGACPNQYILTRRWTASDNCGNTRSTSQVITVVDTTKPVFTSVPANVTIQCSDPVPPVGAATATDNCGGVTVQYLGETTISGSCPNKYQIRRTWRATDQCGNSTVTVQLIQVDDTTPPIFTFVPPDVTILCTEPLPPLVNPTASDNCPGPVNITFLGSTPTGSGCESTYTVTRRWRAEDLCGNSAIATQVITVQSTPFSPEEVEERDAVKPQAPLWDDDRILTLQPNPTTDRVLIGLGSFAGERVVVSIHNEMGQLIYERAVEATSDLMIPVSLRESGATPGLFTVSVRSSGRVVAKRLVLLE